MDCFNGCLRLWTKRCCPIATGQFREEKHWFECKIWYWKNCINFACENGHKDVVRLLLEKSERNIDFNASNNGGLTALMFACIHGHKDVVQLLLDNPERNIYCCNTMDTKILISGYGYNRYYYYIDVIDKVWILLKVWIG